MKPELLQKIVENIAKHEGRVSQMYLDTIKVVTTGVGHAIQKVDDACCLQWFRVDRPASRDEIIADYTNVKYAGKKGTLFLPVEEMDRILAYDLGRFQHILESDFPELYSYPEGAVVAMFDIAFNTGSLRKFPRLTEAVKSGDWKTAAAESVRPQVGAERNRTTAEQFLAVAG